MTTTERAKLRAMEAILNPKPTRTGPTQPHLHLTARSVRGRPAMTPSNQTLSELTYEARQYAAARKRLETATTRLKVVVRAACDEGMSEVEAAKLAGVTRMTVRAWRGKK